MHHWQRVSLTNGGVVDVVVGSDHSQVKGRHVHLILDTDTLQRTPSSHNFSFTKSVVKHQNCIQSETNDVRILTKACSPLTFLAVALGNKIFLASVEQYITF